MTTVSQVARSHLILAFCSVAASWPVAALDASFLPSGGFISSSLVSAYEAGWPYDTCVGPVPVAPILGAPSGTACTNGSGECDAQWCDCPPPGATCPDKHGSCDHSWCRPASPRPFRNDRECGFDPHLGKGEISARASSEERSGEVVGGGIDLNARVVGITGCEDQLLCIGFAVRRTGFDCPEGQLCTTLDARSEQVLNEDSGACCTVHDGRCRISVGLSRYSEPSVTPGEHTAYQVFSAGLYRNGRATFVAGQQLGVLDSVLNNPRSARVGRARIVQGYREAMVPKGEGPGISYPSSPNDPHCRFDPGGSGTIAVRITPSDAKLNVRLHHVTCDTPNVRLCLTMSGPSTTTQCDSPQGCITTAIEDEPIGLVNPTEGCCVVTANGSCGIHTYFSSLTRDLDHENQYTAALFGGVGLQRVTSIDGDDPLDDTGPAFVVGLFLP